MNEDLTQEQKDFIASVNEEVTKTVGELKKGMEADFEKKVSGIIKSIEDKNTGGEFDSLKKDIETLKENVAEVFKKGGSNLDMNTKAGFSEIVDQILDNESYKSFAEGKLGKKTGKLHFETKTISLENSYTGDILISEQSPVVVSHPQPRRVNMRNIITQTTGDPMFPNLTFTKITELDRNVNMVSENGRLPEAAFKAKEETYTTKRIGTHIPISRRMLKSRTYMRSWMITNVPRWIRQSEDFQILKGDGNGENLLGIMNQCPDFKEILGKNVTGPAGSISELESFDNGNKTVFIFANPQPYLNNGMKITFAGFENADYNKTFLVNKMNDRKIMIEVAYTSQTPAEIAAASFEAGMEFAGTVESPNEVDAITAAQKYLTYSIYFPNAVAMNPMDTFRIMSLKNTLGDRLNTNISIINGVLYIGFLPVIETTAILPGEVLIGDFINAAEIVDYTSLEFEFAEDVETKLTNQVVLIVQGELIFPVYNKFAFLKFRLDEVIPLLEK